MTTPHRIARSSARLLGWAVAWLLAWPVMAQTAPVTAAQAEALMKQSGMWAQLADVAPQMHAGMAEAAAEKRRLQASEIERLTQLVDNAYAAPRLRAVALRVIAARLEPSQAQALLAWYGGATGTHMTQLESVPEGAVRDRALQIREGTDALAKLPASRRALITELVGASRTVEATVSMIIDTALGVQAGLASAQPDRPSLGSPALRETLDSQREALTQTFTIIATGSLAQTYASASDAELKQYLAFLASPAGRYFVELGIQAVGTAMKQAAKDLGSGMPATRDAANI